eukprot:2146575-Rhodomonas_salina.2
MMIMMIVAQRSQGLDKTSIAQHSSAKKEKTRRDQVHKPAKAVQTVQQSRLRAFFAQHTRLSAFSRIEADSDSKQHSGLN